jgi:3-oxoacyl-[acyl-carrier-protein] synthase-3
VRPHILSVGSFLPHEPVDNDSMETVLGMVGSRPSLSRRRILKSNGIVERYYAIDRETGRQTHTNTQLTAEAVRAAVQNAGLELDDIDLLSCGTSTPDYMMPNHALMVHGELGNRACDVAATSGTCLSGLTSIKYAVMSVAAGDAKVAIATGSELASSLVRADSFPNPEPAPEELDKNPMLAFHQDFLRWMLSDGAGAVLVGPRDPSHKGLSLAVEWIDIFSFAHELEPCMYWGAEKTKDGAFVGWRETDSLEESVQRGMLNLTQDVRLLGREVMRSTVSRTFELVRERHPITADEVDWLLPHYSSTFFRQEVYDRFCDVDFEIPYERWFTNLTTKGNTGAASVYIMMDDLLRSGQLEVGQKVLCWVPESARFSAGFMLLTVEGPKS